MYSIVVVEDEAAIARGISFLIPRLCPECRVDGIGVDGADGCEIIRRQKPDLVITDISMPEMDGLEMIRTLRAEGCGARFILLSGYSDFNYARQAISLGVEDYITKPVEEEELAGVIRRVCRRIDEERQERSREGQRSDALREYMLREALTGSLESAERTGLLRKAGICPSPWACACVIFGNGGEAGTGEAEAAGFRELILRNLEGCPDCRVLLNVKQADCAVLCLEPGTGSARLRGRLGRLRQAMTERLGREVCFGVSLVHPRTEELKDAFEEALCAFNYRILYGNTGVICYDRIGSGEVPASPVPAERLRELEEAIDAMDEDLCRKALDAVFREVERIPGITPEQIRLLSLNILLTGIRRIPFAQFQLNEYLGRNLFTLEGISRFESIDQLKNWILNILKSMNELMLRESAGEQRDTISEIRDYIRKHFTEDISLKDISERFYINASYFSTLFRKRTGKTYQAYVIELRINMAKKLLPEPGIRIYEICEAVGYSDVNHFNRIFERETGMRPSEYRRAALESKEGKERKESDGTVS
ncbi:MAG: response regulator [Clostridia bacterium]|nr:response regulator [Clostridia bacterium]